MPYLGIATEVGSVQLILEAGIASRRPFAAKANFVPFKKNSLQPLRGDAIDETTPGATDSSGHDSPAASPAAQLSSMAKKSDIESAIGFSHIWASLSPYPWQAPPITLVTDDAPPLFCDVFLAVSLGEFTIRGSTVKTSSLRGMAGYAYPTSRTNAALARFIFAGCQLIESYISSEHHHTCMREGVRARVRLSI
jgi:hypothetical protein